MGGNIAQAIFNEIENNNWCEYDAENKYKHISIDKIIL